MIQKIKQGEVWLANLNPTRGTQLNKCRNDGLCNWSLMQYGK